LPSVPDRRVLAFIDSRREELEPFSLDRGIGPKCGAKPNRRGREPASAKDVSLERSDPSGVFAIRNLLSQISDLQEKRTGPAAWGPSEAP
jgi:hypothetical protein